MFSTWHQQGEITDRTKVYQGPVFSVHQLHIKTPDALTVERDLIHTDPTVTILALTHDEHVVLTSEYRVGINADSVSLPAGIVNPGETAEQAAAREFQEETGFVAESVTQMTTVTSSEGFMDQTAALMLIRFDQTTKKKRHFDADEFVTAELVSFDQFLDWLKTGKINTAQGLAAAAYYQMFLK
ncbi:NUDIX hydrolase [Secundilactobacillus collinoides]|uniref:Hydrolase, NUDIX family n=2 Tax=Secundilactobacillus collinoides TaxID=33960 RepID=A0A0R2B349_SECCO|nr:NUDIX hydrolase [Secundilactobacillus collinoides]KRM73965.1 hydrolase, NUDIX family [Secundilactobacillus collinoides DSM 20515 = JCM 1123]KZL41723.1 NUDIX hydrolase [Secundilactobacillus collinoides]